MRTERARYDAYLRRLPSPGGGGAHRAIYGAGAFGCRAGVAQAKVCADIRKNLPTGTRTVTDREIEDGVARAFADVSGKATRTRPPAPAVSRDALARILKAGHGAGEREITSRSPIPLDFSEAEAAWHVLEALYGENEWLFIGGSRDLGVLDKTIRRRGDWQRILRTLGSCPWEHIIPNPLTGHSAPMKSGDGTTWRGDGCVAVHRFIVVEHDELDLPSQLAFWMAVPLPVAALVFSGKKSIHGLVRVDCADADEWRTQIEERLFPQYLVPMGFDPACKNASRLSRMPGHRRTETGLMQRLLYLAPEGGKAVAA